MNPTKQSTSRQLPERDRHTNGDRLEAAHQLHAAARRTALAGLQMPGTAGLALLGLAGVYASQARRAFKAGAC